MTGQTRKWVHAGLMALVGTMTDIGAQLYSGAFNSATRAMVVGLVVGSLGRVFGAILAAIAMPEPPAALSPPASGEE